MARVNHIDGNWMPTCKGACVWMIDIHGNRRCNGCGCYITREIHVGGTEIVERSAPMTGAA